MHLFLNPSSILIPRHFTYFMIRSSTQYDSNNINVATNYKGVIKTSNIGLEEATLTYEKADNDFYYYHITPTSHSGNNFISIMGY